MNKLKQEIKQIIDAYTALQLTLSIITGFLFAVIIVIPFIAAWINLALIYIRAIYLYLFLTNLTLSAFFFLWTHFSFETLRHYNHDHKHLLKKFKWIEGVGLFALIFLIGTLLILTITPTLL